MSDKLSGGSYYQVANAELSPDGKFALAMTLREGLFLVDLESLSFAQVTLPGGLQPMPFQPGLGISNIFKWFGDNTLVIPLQKGAVYCSWGE